MTDKPFGVNVTILPLLGKVHQAGPSELALLPHCSMSLTISGIVYERQGHIVSVLETKRMRDSRTGWEGMPDNNQ